MRVSRIPLLSLALVLIITLANVQSSFSAVQPSKDAHKLEEHSPNGFKAEITSCPG